MRADGVPVTGDISRVSNHKYLTKGKGRRAHETFGLQQLKVSPLAQATSKTSGEAQHRLHVYYASISPFTIDPHNN